METWVSSLLYNRETVKYLSSAGLDESAAAYPRQPQLQVYYASAGGKAVGHR